MTVDFSSSEHSHRDCTLAKPPGVLKMIGSSSSVLILTSSAAFPPTGTNSPSKSMLTLEWGSWYIFIAMVLLLLGNEQSDLEQ